MNIRRWSVLIFPFLIAVLVVGLLSISASAQCGCGPCCPDRCASLNTDKETYQVGEEVTFIFSNPDDYDVVFERIYIQRGQHLFWTTGEIVYSHEFVGFDELAVPGTSWTWVWNQQNNWGSQVPPGSYVMVIDTLCCGTYKVRFRIAGSCGDPCYRSRWSCCRPCWSWPCPPPPSTCLEPRDPDFFMKYFVNHYEYEDKTLTLRVKDHVMNQLQQMADPLIFREAPADTVVWTENGVTGWRNDALSEIGLSLDPATGKISGDLSLGAGGNYFFFIEALNVEGEVLADIWVEIAVT